MYYIIYLKHKITNIYMYLPVVKYYCRLMFITSLSFDEINKINIIILNSFSNI